MRIWVFLSLLGFVLSAPTPNPIANAKADPSPSPSPSPSPDPAPKPGITLMQPAATYALSYSLMPVAAQPSMTIVKSAVAPPPTILQTSPAVSLYSYQTPLGYALNYPYVIV